MISEGDNVRRSGIDDYPRLLHVFLRQQWGVGHNLRQTDHRSSDKVIEAKRYFLLLKTTRKKNNKFLEIV